MRRSASLVPLLLLAATASAGESRGPVRADPAETGLDPAALARLLDRARDERSSAVVILEDGRLVVEEYYGGKPEPMMAMSATQSVVVPAAVPRR